MKKMDVQQTEGLTVTIRVTGEFGQLVQVCLNVPANFDMDDSASKQIYYDSWKRIRNLPVDHPLHDNVERLKEHFRMSEMILVARQESTYVCFAFITANRPTVKHKIEKVFGKDNVTFDL